MVKSGCCLILSLFCSVVLLVSGCLGAIVWLSHNKPYAPKFNLESVTLKNLKISTYQFTADWNFNISIKNMNDFGWSYGFIATLYNDGNYNYRPSDNVVPFYATDATAIPIFSQGGNNDTYFTARFGGVSMPINYNKRIFEEGSGGNQEVFDVPLELILKGKIEPTPKTSLPRIIRRLASPIHVDCEKVKIGISADSSGDTAHVYLGKGSHCNSRWNSLLLA